MTEQTNPERKNGNSLRFTADLREMDKSTKAGSDPADGVELPEADRGKPGQLAKVLRMKGQLSNMDPLAAAYQAGKDWQSLFAREREKHRMSLVRLIQRRASLPLHEVEDLVEDVFTSAAQTLDKFRGECAFKNWLFRRARWYLDNFQRRGRATKRQGIEVPLESVQDPTNRIWPRATVEMNPESRMLERERQARLRKLFDGLRPIDQEILILYYDEERSYAEMAVLLGIPLGTVRSRLSKARQRFASAVARDEE